MDTILILGFALALISGFLTSGGNIEPLWFGSSGLSSLVIGLGILPIIYGWWLIVNRKVVQINPFELIIPAVLLLSVFFAPVTMNAHFHITQIIVWFVFWISAVILTKLFAKSRQFKHQLLIYTLISALIMLFFSLFKAAINNDLRYGVHISGEFGLHNSYAAAAMLSCVLALIYIVDWLQLPKAEKSDIKTANSSSIWQVTLAVFTFLLGVIGIFFSQSRGVWLCFGLFILCVVIYIFLVKFHSRLRVIIGLTLLFIVLAAVFIPGPFKTHLKNAFNPEDFSVKGRIRFHEVAFKMAVTPPLPGFGNYRFRYPSLQKDPNYFATDPHNLYVQMLAEGQILGALLLLGIIITVIRAILINKKLSPTQAIAALGLVALAIHLAIDFDFTFTTNGLLFALLWAIWQTNDNISKPTGNRQLYKLINLITAGLSVAAGLFMIVNLMAIHLVRLSEQRNDDQSERLAVYATILSPLDQKTWTALALESKNPITTLSAFEKVNQLSPWDARGWYSSANASRHITDKTNQEQVERTIRYYLKAIECDPVNRPYLYFDLATFYAELGRELDQLEIIRAMLIAFNWNEPITPSHPRPQWIYYNNTILQAMYRLIELEDKLGQRSRLYEVCKNRIPLFENYVKTHPVE